MDLERVVQNARDAIGEQPPTDYAFKPAQLPGQVEAQARGLADLLRHSNIATLAERYEAKNAEAMAAQSDFRRAANRANWLVLFTSVWSAVLLVIGTLRLGDDIARPAIVAVTVLGALTAAVATLFVTVARNAKLLEEWYGRRAEAEAARRDYFERLFLVSSNPELLLVRLEFFRRYQLELQTNFYRNRRRRNALSARRLAFLSAGGVAASMLAMTLAGALSSIHPTWIALAGISAITSAITSFVSARETVYRYQQNAESYRQSQDALDKIRERLDDVRLAAAQGHTEPVHQFVAAVHEQLMGEHQQWLKSSDSAQEALRRLQELLEKTRIQPKPSVIAAKS